MGVSDENKPDFVRPINSQGGGGCELMMGNRKFAAPAETRQQRRALSVINQNLVGAQPYPRVVNKRGLSEKHVICDKNQDLVHRPVTRKFATQIASNQEQCCQEAKKPNESIPNSCGLEDFIYIDEEEEDKTVTDLHVPMFLEETEVQMNDVDHMEEVEMEDIDDEEEPIMDIDGRDAKNPLAVVEYVEDIFAYYRRMENSSCVSPDYMAQQEDINEKMRAILIDWLIEVHDKFELMNETLFLTVNLVDRFLAQQTVPRKKLQLVGLVALLLASKYEEVAVPVVGDLVLISDKAYTRKEVLEMESLMLNTLQFNMSLPTPYAFMQRFLKAAQSDKKLEVFSFFLIELCLVEYEMIKFPPSLLAASAIYTAQCTLYGFKQWTKTCEWHTAYSEHQLLECSRLIVNFHQKAGTGRLTGVHRKYCASKFGYAAKCEPAQFLLDTQLLVV